MFCAVTGRAYSCDTAMSRLFHILQFHKRFKRGITVFLTPVSEIKRNHQGKLMKNRSLFPTDEMVFKLMYLELKNIGQRRTMPIKN